MSAPHTNEVTRGFQRTIQTHTGIMPKDQDMNILKIMIDPKTNYETLQSKTQTAWQQPVGVIKEILPPDFDPNHHKTLTVDPTNPQVLFAEYKANLISLLIEYARKERDYRAVQTVLMNFSLDRAKNDELIDQLNYSLNKVDAYDKKARDVGEIILEMAAEITKTREHYAAERAAKEALAERQAVEKANRRSATTPSEPIPDDLNDIKWD